MFCVIKKLYSIFPLFDSQILRFVGKMLSDNPTDKDRTFIISFYLSDDTIAVFEPIQRNSGMFPCSSFYCHSLPIFFFQMPQHFKTRRKC